MQCSKFQKYDAHPHFYASEKFLFLFSQAFIFCSRRYVIDAATFAQPCCNNRQLIFWEESEPEASVICMIIFFLSCTRYLRFSSDFIMILNKVISDNNPFTS